MVEFERPPADPTGFARALDQALCEENRVYGLHRAGDVAILPPRVVNVLPGTRGRFHQALGLSSVQQKFPRILSDPQRDLLLSLEG